ncbi:MAG: hypothetical protein AB7E49_10740 [Campylobacterales bacterium]
MIASAEAVRAYIEKIPPMQETLRQCYQALGEGNLPAAARFAAADPALLYYLRQLTTRPLYGFGAPIKDPAQIFGVLGLGGSRSAVESFVFSRLMPEHFLVFEIKTARFMAFQDDFLAHWLKVLKRLGADEMRYGALPPLLMGAIVVADAVFGAQREAVAALKSAQPIDYDTLLKRFAGVSLFGVVEEIARRWELPDAALSVLKILNDRSGGEMQEALLARWLHLLFFYILSQPEMVAAGLNDFIPFDPGYAAPVMEAFESVVSDASGD